jgi:hypothetical protein
MPPMMQLINQLGAASRKQHRGGRKAHVVAMFGEFDVGVLPPRPARARSAAPPGGGLIGGQPAACYFLAGHLKQDLGHCRRSSLRGCLTDRYR